MKTGITVLALSLGYATLRYNVFKGVPWTDWPLYVTNKAFALSALLLLTIAVVRNASRKSDTRQLLSVGWMFLLMHLWQSLVLLGVSYYPKYFENGKLTVVAGLSLLLGVTAAVTIQRLLKGGQENDARRIALLGAALCGVGIHAALLGYAGWFEPWTWPGWMIPITLVAFVTGLVALGAGLRYGRV
jgi:hypothetical protein